MRRPRVFPLAAWKAKAWTKTRTTRDWGPKLIKYWKERVGKEIEAGQAVGNTNVFARIRLTGVLEKMSLAEAITDDDVIKEGGEEGETAVHFINRMSKYFETHC